jgi:hypothetical protein
VLEVRPQKASKAWLFERIWEFMNYSILFPDEDPVTTDYFGDPVKPLSSPLIKPWVGGAAGGADWRKEAPRLTPLHLGGGSSNDDATESGGQHQSNDGGSDDENERVHSDEFQPVDFLLVIASGEDRTDEDLFAYLVPAPIDLEAYCRQLEKDQFNSLSEHQFGGFPGHDEDGQRSSFRRISLNESGAADSVGSGTFDENMQRLSPRGSFRRLMGLDTDSSSDAENSGHPELLAPALARIPSSGPDGDFLLLGENITKLTPLHGSKQAISDDAANMFPRTMLNTPTNARRDEITERSKFTPRRDFPPSAALFKAMKSKYGENFSMHRLPDTPAAAWALVVPPNARAKLEDSSASPRIASSSSGLDRKASFNSSAAAIAGSPTSTSTSTFEGGAGGSVTSESYGSYSSPSASMVDGDEQMRREIEALRSLDEDLTLRTSENNDEDEVEDQYRFPVNTFVCTLGRKLSQAPYFIKNSADLYQLLQEMGLNSHIRKQRMMSMGSHMDE